MGLIKSNKSCIPSKHSGCMEIVQFIGMVVSICKWLSVFSVWSGKLPMLVNIYDKLFLLVIHIIFSLFLGQRTQWYWHESVEFDHNSCYFNLKGEVHVGREGWYKYTYISCAPRMNIIYMQNTTNWAYIKNSDITFNWEKWDRATTFMRFMMSHPEICVCNTIWTTLRENEERHHLHQVLNSSFPVLFSLTSTFS